MPNLMQPTRGGRCLSVEIPGQGWPNPTLHCDRPTDDSTAHLPPPLASVRAKPGARRHRHPLTTRFRCQLPRWVEPTRRLILRWLLLRRHLPK